MKKTIFFTTALLLTLFSFAQKPSKEQMEANKKEMAEAMKKLNEQTSKMNPNAKKGYDSLLNKYGAGKKMDDAVNTVNSNNQSTGLATGKKNNPSNAAKIASIVATPANAAMGNFINSTNAKAFALLLPDAKAMGKNIFDALTAKKMSSLQIGQAADLLWMNGRTQIAFYVMAQTVANDPTNTDNLNNYASMLHSMGASQLAIPILNNLNARFKNNSTILNNLGQAWFALGETNKAEKYFDSTLRLAVNHPQANATQCLIAESKGNKTAAIAFARAAMKSGYSPTKENKLKQLGYTPTGDDFNNPPGSKNKSNDLLNLSGFGPPAFPKSAPECEALEPVWKEYGNEIEKRISILENQQKAGNDAANKSLQDKMQQGMAMMQSATRNPGSVSQSDALASVKPPLYSTQVSYKEKLVLENLTRKRSELAQKLNTFYKGDGAALEKKYQETIAKINKESTAGEGMGGKDPCPGKLKATNEFLATYNAALEEMFYEYLNIEKQYLNEIAYTNLYTTYPEVTAIANIGLQINWLRDLKAKNNFTFKSIPMTACTTPEDPKGKGVLQKFKDPNCNFSDELKTPMGSISVNCSGMKTTFNLGIVSAELNENLDGATFGDSFENCTIGIGPKIGSKANLGPLEIKAEAGVGVNVEIDRTGITDVIIVAGAEAGAAFGPVGTSAGMEATVSLNSGQGAVNGTGAFSNLKYYKP